MPRSSSSSLPDESPGLRQAQERFIALWAQMGAAWGIPRTMAEVHALLFIADRPMNTDEIMQELGISRGSASMTLRSLVEWGIVSRAHLRGDRKEYFQAEQDVWKLFRTILRERKKREIDPLLDELRACRQMTEPAPGRHDSSAPGRARPRRSGPQDASVEAYNARLDRMIEFVSMIDSISQRLMSSGKGLEIAVKLFSRAS
jgi:DNA-binding transcriptional regulator GbsR (MarR family)